MHVSRNTYPLNSDLAQWIALSSFWIPWLGHAIKFLKHKLITGSCWQFTCSFLGPYWLFPHNHIHSMNIFDVSILWDSWKTESQVIAASKNTNKVFLRKQPFLLDAWDFSLRETSARLPHQQKFYSGYIKSLQNWLVDVVVTLF